ncbi:MAG TPA: O-antigen ligase family protein [Allosphingosinicella sp.]|jgi:O-antigen ligase
MTRPWAIVTALYLAACLLLGGASAAGVAVNAALQLVGLALIGGLLWGGGVRLPRGSRTPFLLALLFLAAGLISLVPLPPAAWTGLPLRDQVAAGFRMVGMDLPSLPISLWPRATVASLLSLIPPAAIFFLVLRLSIEERRLLLWVILIVAGLSIVLGAFQLMGGRDSPLRLYAITNAGAAVGFFANRNHQATLLLCSLPIVGIIAARFVTRRGSRSKQSAGAITSLAMGLFLTVGIAIVGSTAGYALFLPAALASLLIYRRGVVGRLSWIWPAALGVLLVLFIAAGLRGPLSSEELAVEVSQDPSSRRVIAETTVDAIHASFPLGTGLGTFSTVYRLFEEPNRVAHGFANHAHNDYLEIALEMGIVGILLVAGFLSWWALASWRAWRSDFPGAALARGGTVMTAVVLFHSLVDYPIRTAAIAALFALACGFMVRPRAEAREAAPAAAGTGETLRHLEAD